MRLKVSRSISRVCFLQLSKRASGSSSVGVSSELYSGVLRLLLSVDEDSFCVALAASIRAVLLKLIVFKSREYIMRSGWKSSECCVLLPGIGALSNLIGESTQVFQFSPFWKSFVFVYVWM